MECRNDQHPKNVAMDHTWHIVIEGPPGRSDNVGRCVPREKCTTAPSRRLPVTAGTVPRARPEREVRGPSPVAVERAAAKLIATPLPDQLAWASSDPVPGENVLPVNSGRGHGSTGRAPAHNRRRPALASADASDNNTVDLWGCRPASKLLIGWSTPSIMSLPHGDRR